MKMSSVILFSLVLSVLLQACSSESKQKANEHGSDTPSALSDEKKGFGYSSRGHNLVDLLYQEVLESTPSLAKVEEELSNQVTTSGAAQAEFTLYNSKSCDYYSVAESMSTTIADSSLRVMLDSSISNSKKRYDKTKQNWSSLVAQSDSLSKTIGDHHTALKILLTMSLIEKYQASHLPKTDALEQYIKVQKELDSKIVTFVPMK